MRAIAPHHGRTIIHLRADDPNMRPGIAFLFAVLGIGMSACSPIAAAGESATPCEAVPPSGIARFKGGTASGEEITVHIDHNAATYRIVIDASGIAARRGAVRSGRLLRDGRKCAYRLSGENALPAGFGKHGVLTGRLAPADAGAGPVAFIAFRETSNRLSDLAGRWRVSGRERTIDASLPSKPVPGYELRVQPDGRFDNCGIAAMAKQARCSDAGGHFGVHGMVFHLLEDTSGDTSLILGKVGDVFVPILLKRSAASQGLRIFTPRARRLRD
jgi:hypothetical protein